MSDIVSQLITIVLLIMAIGFMLLGARNGKEPAKKFSDLKNYSLEGQMWAAALLGGLALGELAEALDGGLEGIGTMAFALGIWCGVFRSPTRLSGLVPGTIGAFASVLGSIAFVADGPTSTDRLLRGVIVFLLGLLFGMFAFSRRQPLSGLTWFAALDIAVFFSGPVGQSWVEAKGIEAGIMACVGSVIAIILAFMPEVVIGLVAFAAVAVQILGAGSGYLPGNLTHTVSPCIITMIGYGITRLVVTKVVR